MAVASQRAFQLTAKSGKWTSASELKSLVLPTLKNMQSTACMIQRHAMIAFGNIKAQSLVLAGAKSAQMSKRLQVQSSKHPADPMVKTPARSNNGGQLVLSKPQTSFVGRVAPLVQLILVGAGVVGIVLIMKHVCMVRGQERRAVAELWRQSPGALYPKTPPAFTRPVVYAPGQKPVAAMKTMDIDWFRKVADLPKAVMDGTQTVTGRNLRKGVKLNVGFVHEPCPGYLSSNVQSMYELNKAKNNINVVIESVDSLAKHQGKHFSIESLDLKSLTKDLLGKCVELRVVGKVHRSCLKVEVISSWFP